MSLSSKYQHRKGLNVGEPVFLLCLRRFTVEVYNLCKLSSIQTKHIFANAGIRLMHETMSALHHDGR